MFNYIHYKYNNFILDTVLLLNWWSLSPFTLLLLFPNYMSHHENYKIRILGFLTYFFGFILPTELYTIIENGGKFVGYVFFQEIENEFFYLLFDRSILQLFRAILYTITCFSYIYYLLHTRLGSIDERNYIENLKYPVKINLSIVLNIFASSIFILSVIRNYREIVCFFSDIDGIDINYFLINLIISQPFIVFVVIYSLWKNYTRINSLTENTINSVLKSGCCHSQQITVYDLWNDLSTISIAGSFLCIIYLNLAVTIFSMFLTFDYTRVYFLNFLLIYVISRSVQCIISIGFDKCFGYICKKYPKIIYFIDTYFVLSNMMILFRIQQMFERMLIIILYAPINNLNFEYNLIDTKISKNYYSTGLGLNTEIQDYIV
jgi:hypothetical protein